MDEPKLHLWETGVMRITRHPQSFGQALWCFAHTLWIGTGFGSHGSQCDAMSVMDVVCYGHSPNGCSSGSQ